ncbi:MAG: DUF7689 domain-containing protein [Pirellulales bacterium]
MAFPGDLAGVCPRLTPHNGRETSAASSQYNCIAWAAQDTSRFWWPDVDGDGYWPPGILREETLAAFLAAFKSLGYAVCDNGDFEAGIAKVAIYADADGTPTHAARQLSSGRWTSKMGRGVDIEHDCPADLTGRVYGDVAAFLKRAV